MAKDMQVICARSEPEYFCEGGWTGVSLICPVGRRHRIEPVPTHLSGRLLPSHLPGPSFLYFSDYRNIY
jgi:hypothetical protein